MFQNRNREEPEESQEVEEITVIARRLNGAGDFVEGLLNVGHQAVLIKLSNGRYCVLERLRDRLALRDSSCLLEFSDWRAGRTKRCRPNITLREVREVAERAAPNYDLIIDNCYKVAQACVEFTTGVTDVVHTLWMH